MTALGKVDADTNLHDTKRYNIEQSLDGVCNLEFSSSMEQFYGAFHDFQDDEKQYLLHETNQSKIYSMKAKFGDGFVIGKIYKNKPLKNIIREFIIVRTLKLMPYYQLYYDKSQDKMIIIMKLLSHKLTNWVKTLKSMSEYQCKLIIEEILNKLWKLHKIGYVHCDIKPENIMVDETELYLIDFGYLFRENLKNTKEINCKYFGSIGWVPPEIKPYTDQNTRNIYSFSTDIWPIGLLILWLLFDGNQPYLLTKDENNKYSDADYQQRLNYYYYTKLLRNGDVKKGEQWLHKYLKSLHDNHKISVELYKLLKDDILVFDPKKRANCSQIYQNKWFDEIRNDDNENEKKSNKSSESSENITDDPAYLNPDVVNNGVDGNSGSKMSDDKEQSKFEWRDWLPTSMDVESWGQYFEW